MKLALPSPPRRVRVWQVPGALLRIAIWALAGLSVVVALVLGARRELGRIAEERAAQARAVKVEGIVSDVERGSDGARIGVLFRLEGRAYSAGEVELGKDEADVLRRGSPVRLWVDPKTPERPRSVALAKKAADGLRARTTGAYAVPSFALLLLGVGLWLLARREVRPIREGLLVWFTPKASPEGQRRIAGHYFRQDLRYDLTARARPREALIRNGDKLLTAVAPPSRRGIVIDEQLAQRLHWTRAD